MITSGPTYFDQLRQLLGDVGIHVVVFGPGLRSGVNIEPGGRAEVPAVVLARDVDPPGAGVREHHGQPHPARLLGEMSLRLDVLVGAGETGEIVEDGGRGRGPGLRVGQEDRESHLALAGLGPVAQLLHPAVLQSLVLLQLGKSHRLDAAVSDVNHSSETASSVQSIDGGVHVLQSVVLVGDVVLQGHLASHHGLHQLGDLRPGLPATEGRPLPVPASDELEWSGGDFLPSRGHTDHTGLSPASVGHLQCCPHHLHRTSQ